MGHGSADAWFVSRSDSPVSAGPSDADAWAEPTSSPGPRPGPRTEGPAPGPQQPTLGSFTTVPPFIGDVYTREDVPPQTVSLPFDLSLYFGRGGNGNTVLKQLDAANAPQREPPRGDAARLLGREGACDQARDA